MFPRVSPRPRSERAVRTGGLPSHGAQPFPGRVWVRRVSLIPRNITRGKSGEYRAHRASPIPGVFVYPLRTQWRKTSARLRPAAPSRPRTARNAEGHCKQPSPPAPVPSPQPTPTGTAGTCWQSGTSRCSLRGRGPLRGDHRGCGRRPDRAHGCAGREQNSPPRTSTTRFLSQHLKGSSLLIHF